MRTPACTVFVLGRWFSSICPLWRSCAISVPGLRHTHSKGYPSRGFASLAVRKGNAAPPTTAASFTAMSHKQLGELRQLSQVSIERTVGICVKAVECHLPKRMATHSRLRQLCAVNCTQKHDTINCLSGSSHIGHIVRGTRTLQKAHVRRASR